MRYSINKATLESVLKQRNGYLVLASGLVLLCLLLTLIIFQLSAHKRIYLVPPEIKKSFWVSEMQVSSEYLAEMSVFFISLRLNVTPSNVQSQREMLLRYVDPSYYGRLKSQLIEEGDRLTKEDLSMAFYPVDVKVLPLKTIVTGDIKTTIGNESLPSQRVRYLLQYRYNGGRLFVSEFKEIRE